jgi:hypothetical protein
MFRRAQLVKVSAELGTLCDGIAMTVEQLIAGSMSSLSILSAWIDMGQQSIPYARYIAHAAAMLASPIGDHGHASLGNVLHS